MCTLIVPKLSFYTYFILYWLLVSLVLKYWKWEWIITISWRSWEYLRREVLNKALSGLTQTTHGWLRKVTMYCGQKKKDTTNDGDVNVQPWRTVYSLQTEKRAVMVEEPEYDRTIYVTTISPWQLHRVEERGVHNTEHTRSFVSNSEAKITFSKKSKKQHRGDRDNTQEPRPDLLVWFRNLPWHES